MKNLGGMQHTEFLVMRRGLMVLGCRRFWNPKIGRPSMIWLMSLYDGAVMRMEER